MDKRLGFVGIILEDRKKTAGMVNAVLSEFGDVIVSRTGLPYGKRNLGIITIIVEATTDAVGALTGKLGNINGVTVKSALNKEKKR